MKSKVKSTPSPSPKRKKKPTTSQEDIPVIKQKDTEVNQSTGSIKERLEAVKDLEDQGLIDADQAKKKRDEILGEL